MSEDRNSYRNITKAIGLFGGTKVFQVLINIIKNKIVAVLLGPAGMGIAGMITSTTSTISALTGFGLGTSSVRDVSQSFSSGDNNRVNKTITVLRILIIFTGLLGTLVTFFGSSLLSNWAFGNNDYSTSFMIVSVILFMDQLCIGQTVLMQGTFHYKNMAKAALLGSIIGLVIAVPLYYIWKVKAIVPVIISSSFFHLLLTWLYSRKIPFNKVKLTIKQVFSEGKVMLTLGLAIALAGVVNTGQPYLLRLYISNCGNIADVGLYTAGITIATAYIGVVLTAMGSDYAPRLSAVANDNSLLIQAINRQTNLVITLISPLIILFIVFIKQLTVLLYSNDFLVISGMIEWMMFGMFFRAISWCLSFCIIARGESKSFFINELMSSVYFLIFSILGYRVGAFTGMGIAFCLSYIAYTLQMFLYARIKFKFYYNSETLKIILPQIALCLLCFVSMKFIDYGVLRYVVGVVELMIVLFVSYRFLNQMINVKGLITTYKRKVRKNEY